MDPILTVSGLEIARKIKSGELTSREAVEKHIEHIRTVNPVINAVVKDRFDEALKEAEDADRKLREEGPDKLPVFHGVPCTIKECFALTGMPNASGLVARKGIVSDHDAPAVARLRKAGAIPLGVTNTSELCMWMESNNKVYGRSRNPYNPKHIVGGSSGGEGAIIGAGGSPFGLGSDIGGSIRMPAFFNGVFGHKASSGVVPNTGQYPVAVNQALSYLCTGPLARKAQDLWPLLMVLAGPDGEDPACKEIKLGDPGDVDLSELRVIVVEDNGRFKVSQDMKGALWRAAKALEGLGARVEQARFDRLKWSMGIWSSMLHEAGGPTFKDLLGAGKPVRPVREFIKYPFGASPYTLPALGLALLEGLADRFPAQEKKLLAAGRKLRNELIDRIGEKGLMLYPSYPVPAPRHNVPLRMPFHWVYTGILNVMEFPVTQVPMGLNRKGLPLGVQVAGIHGNDHLTVAAALALEKELGGWVPPGFSYIDEPR